MLPQQHTLYSINVMTAVILNVDLAGINGCKVVYPEVTPLLRKWHVDRSVFSFTVHIDFTLNELLL